MKMGVSEIFGSVASCYGYQYDSTVYLVKSTDCFEDILISQTLLAVTPVTSFF